VVTSAPHRRRRRPRLTLTHHKMPVYLWTTNTVGLGVFIGLSSGPFTYGAIQRGTFVCDEYQRSPPSVKLIRPATNAHSRSPDKRG
jgi:hypothetical protein